MITGVHHVGQVVEDFERALGLYEGVLGVTVFETRAVEGENASDNGSETEDDGDPVVRMAFMRVPDCEVHLISREKRGTDIDPLLDSLLVVSPYHVAYTVPDVREAISRMERVGFEMYDSEPVSGLGSYERAFVDPASVPGIAFEFVGPLE